MTVSRRANKLVRVTLSGCWRSENGAEAARRTFQTVFLGVELVDWMQWRVARLRRRSDAVHYARRLLLDELIYRVDVDAASRCRHCGRGSAPGFHESGLYAFTPEPAQWRY